jgi:hypothetical protein
VVFLSALLSLGITFVLLIFLHRFLPSTGINALIYYYFGVFIGVYWFFRHFHKKNNRLMSSVEYKQNKKKLVIANVLIQASLILLWFALFSLVHSTCAQQPDQSCEWINDAFNKLPSGGVLLFVYIVIVAVIALFTWFCVSNTAKMSMRSINKQFFLGG